MNLVCRSKVGSSEEVVGKCKYIIGLMRASLKNSLFAVLLPINFRMGRKVGPFFFFVFFFLRSDHSLRLFLNVIHKERLFQIIVKTTLSAVENYSF